MKRIQILLSLLLMMFSSACTKETVLQTSADQVTAQIKKVIKEKAVDRVYAIDINNGFQSPFPSNAGASWNFSNGFIQIQGYALNQSRNLNYLVKYNVSQVQIDTGESVLALLLYFN